MRCIFPTFFFPPLFLSFDKICGNVKHAMTFLNIIWKKKKYCGDLWAVINPCTQCLHNSDMWCWNFASKRCKRGGWSTLRLLFPFIRISKRGWACRTKSVFCLYIYFSVFMKGFPLNSEEHSWCPLWFKAYRCVDIINYTMKVCMHYYLLPFTYCIFSQLSLIQCVFAVVFEWSWILEGSDEEK